MTIRNLSPATQRSYLHAVTKFSAYFGRPPGRLSHEDVRTYQVHLAGKGVACPPASGSFSPRGRPSSQHGVRVRQVQDSIEALRKAGLPD